MAQPRAKRDGYCNHLLRSLSKKDVDLIAPGLRRVGLAVGSSIEVPNKLVKQIYFPERGIISVVAATPGGPKIEAGLIGYEGMSGVSILLGDGRSANETYVQISVQGWALSAEHLGRATKKSASLQGCFLRYAQAFMIQTAHTALANGRAKIDERLARWVLMAHDRVEGNDIPLTHEFLAIMLGVRRAGVTLALHRLRRRSLVGMARGIVVVLDRTGLEKLANGMYGVPEAEYRRLIGWRGKK